MAPRMSRLLAETSMRRPMPPLCLRLPFPNHFDAELRFGAGGGDEGSRLTGEFQAKLDLHVLGSVDKAAKLARHRDRRRLDRLQRRLEAIADRLDHVARMQPTRYRSLGRVLDFDQDIAAAYLRVGDNPLHRRTPLVNLALRLLRGRSDSNSKLVRGNQLRASIIVPPSDIPV